MKKASKILSAIFAVVMVFTMAVPAFAADAPHDVDIVSNTVTWEGYGDRLPDDCKLTANGAIGQEAIQPKYFSSYSGIVFDVVAGGGYTLDMSYPAGRDRYYNIYMDLVLLNDEPLDEVGPYLSGLPYNSATTAAPQKQYVFTCPDSMVSKPGAELLYHVWLDWGDGEPGADRTTKSGNVQFWLRVNPAQSTTTTQPTTPVQPTTPTQPTTPVQPTTPTQPTTPVQPAQPSTPTTTTTVAKPAPGVSVMLKDGSNEFMYTVKSGDTLSGIAAYYYGKANVYKLIYERNKDTIKNANLIYVGQTIILPSYAAVAQGVARL